MKRQSRPKRDDRTYHGRPKRDRKRQKAIKQQTAATQPRR